MIMVLAAPDLRAENAAKPEIRGETLSLEAPVGRAPPQSAKAGNTKAGSKTEPCIAIRRVEINGLELIAPGVIREAVAPHLDSCVSNTIAGKIIAAINEAHSAKGFVTTQGYVPTQDIRGTRKFVINVVTGRVGRVLYRERNADQGMPTAWQGVREAKGFIDFLSKLSDLVDTFDNPLDRFQLLEAKKIGDLKSKLAIPVEEGEPLDLEKIQQGIDQLNRVPSQKAEAKLEAGEKPGTSNVVITVPRQDSFRLSLGYEINGVSLNTNGSTSAGRARIDIAKDNWIGINDSWAGSFASGANSNEAKGSYSIGWRWMTFSLDSGYSENLTPLGSAAELFSQTFTAGANTNWLLQRNRNGQTAIQTGLHWRHGKRFINSVELMPQTVSYARLGLTHTLFRDNSQTVFSGGASKGLGILGAMRDSANPDFTTPRARFLKLDAGINHTQLFKGWGTWRLDMSGQWAPHALYSDDQLVVGSGSSVRGFTRNPFRADYGGIARSEFSTAWPFEKLAEALGREVSFLSQSLAGWQIYSFADFGGGHDIANRRDLARSSLGAGLRYRQGRLSADLSIARPIWQSGIRATRETYRPEFYFTFTAKAF